MNDNPIFDLKYGKFYKSLMSGLKTFKDNGLQPLRAALLETENEPKPSKATILPFDTLAWFAPELLAYLVRTTTLPKIFDMNASVLA